MKISATGIRDISSVELPNGRYLVTDPCYLIQNQDVWLNNIHKNGTKYYVVETSIGVYDVTIDPFINTNWVITHYIVNGKVFQQPNMFSAAKHVGDRK